MKVTLESRYYEFMMTIRYLELIDDSLRLLRVVHSNAKPPTTLVP